MLDNTPDVSSVRKTLDKFADSLKFIGTGTGAYSTPKASQPQLTSEAYEGFQLYDRQPIEGGIPVVQKQRESLQVVQTPVHRDGSVVYVERREPQVIPGRYTIYEVYEPDEVRITHAQQRVIFQDPRTQAQSSAIGPKIIYRTSNSPFYQGSVVPSNITSPKPNQINDLFFSKNNSLRLSHHQNRRRRSSQTEASLRNSHHNLTVKGTSAHDMFLPEDVKVIYLNPGMIKKDFKDKVDLDCDQVTWI